MRYWQRSERSEIPSPSHRFAAGPSLSRKRERVISNFTSPASRERVDSAKPSGERE